MTSAEIRRKVSPMVIWMADAAIRMACKAVNNNKDTLNAHNIPEVETAGEVLFRMFHACNYDIENALIVVANGHKGYMEYLNFNYFNEFVAVLQKELEEPIEFRKRDWIVDNL